ncbi:hypothetical protein F5X96DRAFT_679708 [Biscogniauxia mediterranea]|nr:hypothetical protein F5X96DRAFT_679708 [Biscogniauxia mediterranea]
MAKTRVRTGCLKCRVRRRKCDEGKPRCQRCVAGGFECVYGTRLSFLPQNSFTVDSPSSSNPPPTTSYRTIQFVTPESPAPSAPKQTSTEPDQQPGTPAHTATDDSPGGQPRQARESTETSTHADDTHVLSPKSSNAPQRELPSPNSALTDSPDTYTQTGRYQIALDALLSLGAEENEPAAPTDPSSSSSSSSSSLPSTLDRVPTPARTAQLGEPAASHGGGGLDERLPGDATTKTAADDNASVFHHNLPEDRVLQLMQCYRYDVAPWLDMCDLGQGFGIYVACLAQRSRALLCTILSLAAAASQERGLGTGAEEELAAEDGHDGSATPTPVFDAADVESQIGFLCRVLIRARKYVVRLPDGRGPGLPSLLEEGLPPFRHMPVVCSLGLHLLLRLELAAALVEEKALPVSASHLDDPPTTLWHKTPLARDVFVEAHEPLAFCIRALEFCFGDGGSCSLDSPVNMVGVWTSLVDDLNAWYVRRRQEFQSIIELDHAEDGIPVVFFTSGAAIFANQLYHTAMLLLLQHKPRTAPLPTWQRSSTLSFLWHARRICGISLNNDRRECWDPSLVASLFMASKRMSHVTQHHALLEGFDRIGVITSWDVSPYKTLLHSEWAP